MSLAQHISSLNFPSDILKSIIEKGYHIVQDVRDNEIGSSLNIEELTRIPETKTALQLLEDREFKKCVNTFIKSLDEILNGVLKNGLITEFVGMPGSGRTQVCLHLSISAQIIEHNTSAETVYICSNMNFSISRLKEIAETYIRECEYFKTSTIDSILKRIHYADVITLGDLQILMDNFELFLKQHENVSLVIIDSISHPLRQIESNEKTPMAYSIIQRMRYLATKYSFTVIVTNDMTTVLGKSGSCIVPSLRDSFYHIVNNRIIFSNVCQTFQAELLKSSVKLPAKCTFNFYHSARLIFCVKSNFYKRKNHLLM